MMAGPRRAGEDEQSANVPYQWDGVCSAVPPGEETVGGWSCLWSGHGRWC